MDAVDIIPIGQVTLTTLKNRKFFGTYAIADDSTIDEIGLNGVAARIDIDGALLIFVT